LVGTIPQKVVFITRVWHFVTLLPLVLIPSKALPSQVRVGWG
jgi:hypothetical protein